jgi:hypothetical protein
MCSLQPAGCGPLRVDYYSHCGVVCVTVGVGCRFVVSGACPSLQHMPSFRRRACAGCNIIHGLMVVMTTLATCLRRLLGKGFDGCPMHDWYIYVTSSAKARIDCWLLQGFEHRVRPVHGVDAIKLLSLLDT